VQAQPLPKPTSLDKPEKTCVNRNILNDARSITAEIWEYS